MFNLAARLDVLVLMSVLADPVDLEDPTDYPILDRCRQVVRDPDSQTLLACKQISTRVPSADPLPHVLRKSLARCRFTLLTELGTEFDEIFNVLVHGIGWQVTEIARIRRSVGISVASLILERVIRDRGLDGSRSNHDDFDAKAGEFETKGIGESMDCRLGCRVRSAERHAGDSGDGTDVDHYTRSASDHVRDCGLRYGDQSKEIGIKSLPDIVDRCLDQRSNGKIDTGIVDENVNAALRGSGDLVESVLDRFLVRDVQLYTLNSSRELAKRLDVTSSCKDSVRLLSVELDGHRSTETGRAAGNYDYLTRIVVGS